MVKITFSWDDGAVEDLKLAEISARYNIPAMFFIPGSNSERKVLSPEEILMIKDRNLNIGSHTRSHTYLGTLSEEDAYNEMSDGKKYLEDITGEKIVHFCFPGGEYNGTLLSLSKKLFRSARTADTCVTRGGDFLVKPTFHFYDRGYNSLLYHSLMNDFKLHRYILSVWKTADYFNRLTSIMNKYLNNESEGFIMIWGHSWEIEKFGLWTKLDTLFQFLTDNFRQNLVDYEDFLK